MAGVRHTAIAAALSLTLLSATSVRAQSVERTRAENDRLFRAAAELYSIDPDLLAAIATVESGGNADAVSPKGAQGLMQLMPGTASRFGVIDPFDPVSNTLGAVRLISFLRQYRTTHGDAPLNLPELLAAYNAGEGAVDKYNGVPPYPETQQYVRRVLLAYLFRDSHSPLAERLGARPLKHNDSSEIHPIRSKPSISNLQPVVAREKTPRVDQIDKLTEIQRLRQIELGKQQQTASSMGEADGSR
ncbi:MAG TPA: lytic transglycosylase domain-containing protein [Candidatus Binatus sp.]|nr:lytic transglycosylase domain-containing protein [Candidatus Binatus sp.]